MEKDLSKMGYYAMSGVNLSSMDEPKQESVGLLNKPKKQVSNPDSNAGANKPALTAAVAFSTLRKKRMELKNA